ncbi:hypothetical protein [Stenotrophomonas maltophilia]|uniref:hypothetical protein n=1 Tax=Stenotrophomonas maltophilia TaxID=40324 RepID=UPI001FB972BC|nr:hypothetical protein [Stenotrophomonas maltophilia]
MPLSAPTLRPAMPAEAAPVRRLARRSLRVHALLIGVVVLATLQAGLLLPARSF